MKTQPLPEEEVVARLTERVNADIMDIWRRMAPDGRPPFTVPLSKAEQEAKFAGASPTEHQMFLKQIAAIPDVNLRNTAYAEYFKRWAQLQLAKGRQGAGGGGGDAGGSGQLGANPAVLPPGGVE